MYLMPADVRRGRECGRRSCASPGERAEAALEAAFEVAPQRPGRAEPQPIALRATATASSWVPRVVNGAHPADAEQTQDVIAGAERLADTKWAACGGVAASGREGGGVVPTAERRARGRRRRRA